MSITTLLDGIVEVVHCDTAAEFLDYLQLHHVQWSVSAKRLDRSPVDSAWIFRGQRKADWTLVPSAMRDVVRATWFTEFETSMREYVERLLMEYKRYDDFPGAEPIINLEKFVIELILQITAEWHFVAQFVRLADQVGYAIPEDKTFDDISKLFFEDVIDDLMRKTDKLHPRLYRFDPVQIEYSLAQHHGIPTRLLDFTDMSFAAAFFAAEDAVNCIEDPCSYEIVVWAIHRDVINLSELTEVRPRRGKIAYLHAQSGLFLYDTMANRHFMNDGKWRSFADVIAQTTYSIREQSIRKVVLSAKEAAHVLRLLSKENITRAHLMPTYDNITETLKMSQLISHFNTE